VTFIVGMILLNSCIVKVNVCDLLRLYSITGAMDLAGWLPLIYQGNYPCGRWQRPVCDSRLTAWIEVRSRSPRQSYHYLL